MIDKVYVSLDETGTYRVGGTRMTLDLIVHEYLQGGTVESVAHAFPGVGMEEICGAIAFYLANRDEVHDYLKRREAEAQKIRAEIEALPVPPVVARLRAIKAAKQSQS